MLNMKYRASTIRPPYMSPSSSSATSDTFLVCRYRKRDATAMQLTFNRNAMLEH